MLFYFASSFAAVDASQQMLLKLKGFISNIESQKSSVQGGAVAILYKGQVIYKTTFGHQKGSTGGITEHTLFPLASSSKPISAIAIALMVDQGLLSFDEEFTLPYIKSPINLVHLMSHTTGYQFRGDAEIEQGLTRQKLFNVLKKLQPKTKPGNSYFYSNAIFSMVEEALNKKKLSLEKAIDNLCTALGTNEVKLSVDANQELAYPHSKKMVDGVDVITALPFPPYYPKTVPASAGIFASINGMIEIYKLCFGYRPDLISPATLKRMFTEVRSNHEIFKWRLKFPVDAKNVESTYALGWRVLKVKDRPGKDLIFHSGAINGIRSFIGFIPSEDIGIIVLTNQDGRFSTETGMALWGEFFD
jgi:beta-lactamase class C